MLVGWDGGEKLRLVRGFANAPQGGVKLKGRYMTTFIDFATERAQGVMHRRSRREAVARVLRKAVCQGGLYLGQDPRPQRNGW